MCAAAWLGVGACGVGRVLGCCEWVWVFMVVVYGCEGGLVVVVLVLICVRIGFRFEG